MADERPQKTDFEKLAHIFAALCACEWVIHKVGCDDTLCKGIPIKDWIADAKQDFC
jgi:hypothetical protein